MLKLDLREEIKTHICSSRQKLWTDIARQLDIPWQVAEIEIARLIRNDDSCLRSEPLSSNTPEVSHSEGQAPSSLPAFQPPPPLYQHPSKLQGQAELPSYSWSQMASPHSNVQPPPPLYKHPSELQGQVKLPSSQEVVDGVLALQ